MTKLRKAIMISAMVVTMGAATISSFAATSATGGTGTPTLDELKAQRLELMKDRLEDRVEAGVITQAQADAMIARMKEYQALCDGTGGYGAGRMMGNGYGMMGNGYRAGGQGYGGGLGQTGCPYYQAQ
jgi:hypothetical protein